MEQIERLLDYEEPVCSYGIYDDFIEITKITLNKFKTDEALNYLMEKMKKIKLTENTNFLYYHIPTYITHLSIIDTDISPRTYFEYNNLHNGLLSLCIRTDEQFSKSLENLPPTLETLMILSSNNVISSLSYLPVSLKHLCIRSRNRCNLDNLPPNLETLFITGYMFDVYILDDLNNLPENLKIFNCSKSCISDTNKWIDIRKKISARYPNLTIII